MSFFILGFFTGLSLILAIGAQNIFVIEQGLKKQFIFIVCVICAFSDFLLIFLGIFLFHYFESFFSPSVELILNILLFLFLVHFIWKKLKNININFEINQKNETKGLGPVIIKTLGFTYLNPHVFSDTVSTFNSLLTVVYQFPTFSVITVVSILVPHISFTI